jgi:hypothetical protein
LDDKGNVIARGIRSSKFVNGRTITGIESGGKFMPLDPGWRPESISTATIKAIEKAKVDFITSPSIAGAKKLMELAADNDTGDGKEIDFAKKQIKEKLGSNFDFSTIQPATNEGMKKMSAPADESMSMQPAVFNADQDQGGFMQTSGRDIGRESPAMYRERLKRESAAAESKIQEQKELSVAEKKPVAEAKGKQKAQDINNQAFSDKTYEFIQPISELIKKSTGSGIGASVDVLASQIGKGTDGAAAIAQLEVLSYPILANVPRFEGPQSDYDVKIYQRAAGDFANPEKPVKTRLAALQGMITLLKKYDKEGKNDWTFSQTKPVEFRVIKREKIQ